MEQSELINLWKSYDQKLEHALTLNRSYAKDILKLKTQSLLGSMKPIKIFTILAGCIWVVIGGIIVTNLFIHAYSQVSHFFLYSAAVQLLLTAAAVFIYLYQLVLVETIDFSDSVIKVQKKLAYLKSSTLWSARLLFLQLPAWTTFYLSENLIRSGNLPYILINGLITAVFTYTGVWLFFNIRYSNRNRKWFRLLFEGREWTPIIESIGFYQEIEQFNVEAEENTQNDDK